MVESRKRLQAWLPDNSPLCSPLIPEKLKAFCGMGLRKKSQGKNMRFLNYLLRTIRGNIMKLSVSQLRRIIKEEVSRMLRENTEDVSSEKARKNLPVSDLREKAKKIQDKLSDDSLAEFNKLLMDLFDLKDYKWNWDVVGKIYKMYENHKLQEIDDFLEQLQELERESKDAEEYSDYQQGLDESRLRRKLRRR
jgi:hypothetical protein